MKLMRYDQKLQKGTPLPESLGITDHDRGTHRLHFHLFLRKMSYFCRSSMNIKTFLGKWEIQECGLGLSLGHISGHSKKCYCLFVVNDNVPEHDCTHRSLPLVKFRRFPIRQHVHNSGLYQTSTDPLSLYIRNNLIFLSARKYYNVISSEI